MHVNHVKLRMKRGIIMKRIIVAFISLLFLFFFAAEFLNMSFFKECNDNQPNYPLFPLLQTSDLPVSYSPSFSGESSNILLTQSFTNVTSNDLSVVVKNTYSNASRVKTLNLNSYTISGYSISKVDINIRMTWKSS